MNLKSFRSQRGFTLIELLVVIAIIAILATLILVALAAARDRARDGRITQNIANIATSLEICGDRGDRIDYRNCDNDNAVTQLLADIERQNPAGTRGVGVATDTWCAYGQLRVKAPATYACRDSTGIAVPRASGPCDVNNACAPPVP